MFYKLMSNNMVIDLLKEAQWVRYLPMSKRFIGTDSQAANAIMGSDHDTVYHIVGKPYNFATDLKSVEVVKIDEIEYGRLETQFAIQRQENNNMKNEIASLKEQLNSQQDLLKAILEKLS